MLQENLNHLKRGGFDVEPPGYAFTLRPKGTVNLCIEKEECEAIQKIGKILEIRILEGPQLRVTVLNVIIGTG